MPVQEEFPAAAFEEGKLARKLRQERIDKFSRQALVIGEQRLKPVQIPVRLFQSIETLIRHSSPRVRSQSRSRPRGHADTAEVGKADAALPSHRRGKSVPALVS